jgi:quercetin dioxygenase-like cupin family protein
MNDNQTESRIQAALPERIRALPRSGSAIPTHLLEAPDCDVLFVTAPAGSGVPPHHHDTDNATLVVTGETVLTTADGEHRYGAGAWYETSPGEEHAVRFDVDTVQVELRFAVPTDRQVRQEGAGT